MNEYRRHRQSNRLVQMGERQVRELRKAEVGRQMLALDEIAGFRVRPGFYNINGATMLTDGVNFTAYSNGGTATVEFWSNANAKEGKTYATESVQIGARGYKSYRHTYENGVETNVEEIATTWYIKD